MHSCLNCKSACCLVTLLPRVHSSSVSVTKQSLSMYSDQKELSEDLTQSQHDLLIPWGDCIAFTKYLLNYIFIQRDLSKSSPAAQS